MLLAVRFSIVFKSASTLCAFTQGVGIKTANLASGRVPWRIGMTFRINGIEPMTSALFSPIGVVKPSAIPTMACPTTSDQRCWSGTTTLPWRTFGCSVGLFMPFYSSAFFFRVYQMNSYCFFLY